MPARDETSIVRFDLTEDDLAAFHLRLLDRTSRLKRQFWFGLLALPLAWAAVWWIYVRTTEDPEESAQRLWWLLLYIPIHAALYPRRWKSSLERLRERLVKDFQKSPLLGKRRVVITPDEIREHNPMSEVASKWSDVYLVERHDERVFVYLSPKAAIIVPKRAFEKPEAFEEFAADVNRNWRGPSN